jgi:hypothetical protein
MLSKFTSRFSRVQNNPCHQFCSGKLAAPIQDITGKFFRESFIDGKYGGTILCRR